MKLLTTIILIVCISTVVKSQQYTISYHSSSIAGSDQPSTQTTIEKASVKEVTKKWESYLKKQKGKLNEDDDIFYLDNSIIKGIGSDTLDIWSTVSEAGESVIINLAVNSNGNFITNLTGNQPGIDAFMKEFVLIIRRDQVSEEVAAAQKILDSREKQLEKTQKEIRHLEKDNQEMKSKIADNERSIEKNHEAIKENRKLIEQQKEVVRSLESKLKSLD